MKSSTCPDLPCHLLLIISQLNAGAFPRGEVFRSGDHLPVFKLQVLHQQLWSKHRVERVKWQAAVNPTVPGVRRHDSRQRRERCHTRPVLLLFALNICFVVQQTAETLTGFPSVPYRTRPFLVTRPGWDAPSTSRGWPAGTDPPNMDEPYRVTDWEKNTHRGTLKTDVLCVS